MKHLWYFLIYTVAVFITARVLPGIQIKSFKASVGVALLLVIANWTIKPILNFIAFPITLLTLGLFSLVINAIIVIIVDKIMEEEFEVDGFLWAVIYAITLSVINGVLQWVL
jgi:putative membrane protein